MCADRQELVEAARYKKVQAIKFYNCFGDDSPGELHSVCQLQSGGVTTLASHEIAILKTILTSAGPSRIGVLGAAQLFFSENILLFLPPAHPQVVCQRCQPVSASAASCLLVVCEKLVSKQKNWQTTG